jgi:hypothetical protein
MPGDDDHIVSSFEVSMLRREEKKNETNTYADLPRGTQCTAQQQHGRVSHRREYANMLNHDQVVG